MFCVREIVARIPWKTNLYLNWKSSYDTQFIIPAVYKPIRDNYFLLKRYLKPRGYFKMVIFVSLLERFYFVDMFLNLLNLKFRFILTIKELK